MSAFRLDSVAPAIAEHFRQASTAQRRHAALVACEHAAASTGLTGQHVCQALDVLRGIATPDSSVCSQLESLAATFDDEYFRLNDDNNPAQKEEALRLFSKARAVSALVFALSTDDTQLHEAIYEAIAAMDDPGDLARSVQSALR